MARKIMKLNALIFAIVDQDGVILGNGDAKSIYADRPDEAEIAWVHKFCAVPVRVVRCRIVEEKEEP